MGVAAHQERLLPVHNLPVGRGVAAPFPVVAFSERLVLLGLAVR